MLASTRSRTRSNCFIAGLASGLICSASAGAASLAFFENDPSDYDYGRQTSIPAGFGTGEFTLEIWLRPDNSYPVGPTTSGTDQRRNWSDANPAPYTSENWWYAGNFLLDGHNNASFSSGTFSLQMFNGGRLRWLFGDGGAAQARDGELHAIQNAGGASLLDGQWHQVTLVRRANGSGATLEMWIDGTLSDTETTSSMTDMRQWWNNWTGFSQQGWVWGAEKQAALGSLAQYEDYKGNIDELRFWSRAKTNSEISQNYRAPVTGAETGLVGHYAFETTSPCNQVGGGGSCITGSALKPGALSSLNAPLTGSPPPPASDTQAPSVPTGLTSSSVTSASVALSWTASTDNVSVTGYDVFRDGVRVAQPANASYTDSSVTANTTYSYTVLARDEAGNVSAQSTALSVTTATSTTPPPAPPPPSGGGGGGGGGGGSQSGLEFLLLGLLAALTRRRSGFDLPKR